MYYLILYKLPIYIFNFIVVLQQKIPYASSIYREPCAQTPWIDLSKARIAFGQWAIPMMVSN